MTTVCSLSVPLETNLESHHSQALSSNATGFATATLGRSRPFSHSMRRARLSTLSHNRIKSKEAIEASMARPASQVFFVTVGLEQFQCTSSHRRRSKMSDAVHPSRVLLPFLLRYLPAQLSQPPVCRRLLLSSGKRNLALLVLLTFKEHLSPCLDQSLLAQPQQCTIR